MRSLWYFIRESFSNSKKNFSTTLGAIVTIFLSLLVAGVVMLASFIVEEMGNSVESQVSITIWVHDDALEADVVSVEEYTRSLPEVSEVVYVSKEEALERFKEQTTSQIAENLDGNPLPASIEVALADPEQLEFVVDQITSFEAYPRVIDSPDDPSESIRYGGGLAEQIFSTVDIINLALLVLVILLVFVALIFINNTIRLAILARRKEIAIMRLVGASNGFIRGPFLMEGALQALLGAGMAIGSIALFCNYLLPRVQMTFHWLPLTFATASIWRIYLVLLGVGLIIGLFGSAWAMRRYLKV
ncbi:MAG: permease-like cell division protein FtsX [Coriobacteriales bacterium]|jgi:cell division transport system permease protein|nr:permease-like cell division protein FtsX [Coriobacteriales bacterium]